MLEPRAVARPRRAWGTVEGGGGFAFVCAGSGRFSFARACPGLSLAAGARVVGAAQQCRTARSQVLRAEYIHSTVLLMLCCALLYSVLYTVL